MVGRHSGPGRCVWLLLLVSLALLLAPSSPSPLSTTDDAGTGGDDTLDFATDTSDSGEGCEFDELQLASDGTIAARRLEMGERVRPNTTLAGVIEADDYHWYHLCIVRHEHEHAIHVALHCGPGEDANLFLSSLDKYPRRGHSSWIAQRAGDDTVKLLTYLDGFPRRRRHNRRRRGPHEQQQQQEQQRAPTEAETEAEFATGRSIALHIGVVGVTPRTTYNLTIAVTDLPRTAAIREREEYYTRRHLDDQRQRHAQPPEQRSHDRRRLRSG